MRLGPESRRQVGDNYEQIIVDLLADFGWRNVASNHEIDVPTSVRPSGQQGMDASYVYYDPSKRTDIGVHVESKKCRNLSDFKSRVLDWLIAIDSAIYYLSTGMYKLPFVELSTTGSVDVQEALLSVWIDEDFAQEEFYRIVTDKIQEFMTKRKWRSSFAATHIFGNQKLLQLQAVITQLQAAVTRLRLSGQFRFEYPKLGAHESPNLSYLNSDHLFVKATVDQNPNAFELLAFFMGDTSRQQMHYLTATAIDLFGPHIADAQGFHAFVWDLPPSDPEKHRLWESMFQRSIQSKYPLRDNLVTFQGFNPSYLSIQG